MDANVLFTALIQLLLLWLALSIHEAAHAWAASRFGDPTARELGRLTLNPLRHLDLLGSLLFPGLLLAFGFPVFGWGRPTPVLEEKLRRPGRDGLLVLAAGSLANLAVVGLATVAIAVVAAVMGDPARESAFLALVYRTGARHSSSYPVMFTLVRLITINAFVAAFNLIPLPPLDGGQIALRLLPPDWAARLAAIRPYGFMIGVVMAVVVLPLLFIPFYGILSLVIQLS
ncbi:MAG TPA: site-2 protease family protein [Thermoanaerobaculia bacterium]|jgi:Zn-dependent protease